jgi:hypothetical protein
MPRSGMVSVISGPASILLDKAKLSDLLHNRTFAVNNIQHSGIVAKLYGHMITSVHLIRQGTQPSSAE